MSSIFFYQAYKPFNLFFRFFLLQKKRPQEEKAKQVYNSGYEVFGKKKKEKKREKTILLSIEQLKNAGHVGHGPGIGRLGVIMPATGGNRRSSGAFFLPHEAPTAVSGGLNGNELTD